jgi:hypothetical protein
MATPAPNARVEDIEDEIVFQQTLLEMLDQDADSYHGERQRLETILLELGARLEALTGNGYTQGSDESQASTYGGSSQDFQFMSAPAYLGTSLISIFLTPPA